MADRRVTKSKKDEDGDITVLCNDAASWSPRHKRDAIADIDSRVHRYFVDLGRNEVDVIVVDDPGGKYLRTDPDKSTKNNLDDLPDC